MTDTPLNAAETDTTATQEGAEAPPAEAEGAEAQTQVAEAEGENPAEGQGQEAETEDEPQGAPEEYANFEVPEGVTLDQEVLGEFKALGKELNLPQAQAQKVADLGVQLAQKWAAAQTANVEALQAEWLETTKADKDFGGEKLAATLADGKKALDAYGTDALREVLNQTKLGNHPEVIRFFAKVGQTLNEDGHVSPSGQASERPKDVAKRLFPNHA